jgi:hypothetical protein
MKQKKQKQKKGAQGLIYVHWRGIEPRPSKLFMEGVFYTQPALSLRAVIVVRWETCFLFEFFRLFSSCFCVSKNRLTTPTMALVNSVRRE